MYIFLVFKLYTQYEIILYLYIVSIVVQRIQDIHIISRITHVYACIYIYIQLYIYLNMFFLENMLKILCIVYSTLYNDIIYHI